MNGAPNLLAVLAWLESCEHMRRQLENLAAHVLARHDIAVHRYLLLRDKPPLRGCRP